MPTQNCQFPNYMRIEIIAQRQIWDFFAPFRSLIQNCHFPFYMHVEIKAVRPQFRMMDSELQFQNYMRVEINAVWQISNSHFVM